MTMTEAFLQTRNLGQAKLELQRAIGEDHERRHWMKADSFVAVAYPDGRATVIANQPTEDNPVKWWVNAVEPLDGPLHSVACPSAEAALAVARKVKVLAQ